MTLEKIRKGKTKADTLDSNLNRIVFLVALSTPFLAIIYACATGAAATYFALHLYRGAEDGSLKKLFNCCQFIGQAAFFVNGLGGSIMGIYTGLTRRLRPIVLMPLLGFNVIGYTLQRLIIFADHSYGIAQTLQVEIAVFTTGIILMIIIVFKLVAQIVYSVRLWKLRQEYLRKL